jgi:hypothetical protein
MRAQTPSEKQGAPARGNAHPPRRPVAAQALGNQAEAVLAGSVLVVQLSHARFLRHMGAVQRSVRVGVRLLWMLESVGERGPWG